MSVRLTSYDLIIYSPRQWSLIFNFVHLRSNQLCYVIRLFKVGQIKQTAQVYDEYLNLPLISTIHAFFLS